MRAGRYLRDFTTQWRGGGGSSSKNDAGGWGRVSGEVDETKEEVVHHPTVDQTQRPDVQHQLQEQ